MAISDVQAPVPAEEATERPWHDPRASLHPRRRPRLLAAHGAEA